MSEPLSNVTAEQAELEALLASGIFARAPSLAQFLTYVCKKHFAGEHHLIKEVYIATEALGRPESFDQKKDSIVRVEAHRLRKRLRQYYEGAGAEHEIQIDVPAGGYAPAFRRREVKAEEAEAATVAAAPAVETMKETHAEVLVAAAEAQKQGFPRWALAVAAVVIIGLLTLVSFQLRG